MNSKEKIKYNKKMIGQRVLVTQTQRPTFEAVVVDVINAVSYTHLTLPTIYSV